MFQLDGVVYVQLLYLYPPSVLLVEYGLLPEMVALVLHVLSTVLTSAGDGVTTEQRGELVELPLVHEVASTQFVEQVAAEPPLVVQPVPSPVIPVAGGVPHFLVISLQDIRAFETVPCKVTDADCGLEVLLCNWLVRLCRVSVLLCNCCVSCLGWLVLLVNCVVVFWYCVAPSFMGRGSTPSCWPTVVLSSL